MIRCFNILEGIDRKKHEEYVINFYSYHIFWSGFNFFVLNSAINSEKLGNVCTKDVQLNVFSSVGTMILSECLILNEFCTRRDREREREREENGIRI